jgi:hypothetical protein
MWVPAMEYTMTSPKLALACLLNDIEIRKASAKNYSHSACRDGKVRFALVLVYIYSEDLPRNSSILHPPTSPDHPRIQATTL